MLNPVEISQNPQGQRPLKMVLITHNRVNEGIKRCFDIVFCIALLAIFSPVMIAIALAIRLTSKGPILFCQERLTKGEIPFPIFKFRTMVVDAEAKTGPMWVQKHDSRITPLGQLLRKTHLDELPQLFNILRGEMSFVGPRPERPIFVNQFKDAGVPRYSQRHLVKAGITGYAQILNPNPDINDIQEKTQADLWYIEHWSPWLDLKLIWQTFLHFTHSGVESLQDVSRRITHKILSKQHVGHIPEMQK